MIGWPFVVWRMLGAIVPIYRTRRQPAEWYQYRRLSVQLSGSPPRGAFAKRYRRPKPGREGIRENWPEP